MSAGICLHQSICLYQSIWLRLYRRNRLTSSLHLQVGVVGSGQGMTDYKKVARHDFNPDAE